MKEVRTNYAAELLALSPPIVLRTADEDDKFQSCGINEI